MFAETTQTRTKWRNILFWVVIFIILKDLNVKLTMIKMAWKDIHRAIYSDIANDHMCNNNNIISNIFSNAYAFFFRRIFLCQIFGERNEFPTWEIFFWLQIHGVVVTFQSNIFVYKTAYICLNKSEIGVTFVLVAAQFTNLDLNWLLNRHHMASVHLLLCIHGMA